MLVSNELATQIEDFVKDFDEDVEKLEVPSNPFWAGLREVGSELWLDTGDIDAAAALWTADFTALTTNNSLLNAEIQKGIYDGLITEALSILSAVDDATKVIEIAFILNARHGLRLVHRFGGKVSVELHTDLANDVERTLHYARRYAEISPKNFIVKIPLTPAGLIATRILRGEGIAINFTLGFSARQNAIAAGFAGPDYVNVFLGRLGSYIKMNELGSGELVGERATIASQRIIDRLTSHREVATKQIAASIRGAGNIADLAGVDVYTIPVKAAHEALSQLDGSWEDRLNEHYRLEFTESARLARLHVLYEVSFSELGFVQALSDDPPSTPAALVERAHHMGVGDLFPHLGTADLATIAEDGKIPVHRNWAGRIRTGELAIDSLLNLAGLAAFSKDQKDLDDRIRRVAGL